MVDLLGTVYSVDLTNEMILLFRNIISPKIKRYFKVVNMIRIIN